MFLFNSIIRKIVGNRAEGQPMFYRNRLFEEMIELVQEGHFGNSRLLEIGPKDGLDSLRLSSLNPSELVLMDLPEKSSLVKEWVNNIICPHIYVEANLMYMSVEELDFLGTFDLVWCTGVLYHNAEQLRLLRRLHNLLNPGGYLVLESATVRGPWYLRKGNFVKIYHPDTYNDTGTITHLPTVSAIKSWLKMVGFSDIYDSKCYKVSNPILAKHRYACICRRPNTDLSGTYYGKSGQNPTYILGEST